MGVASNAPPEDAIQHSSSFLSLHIFFCRAFSGRFVSVEAPGDEWADPKESESCVLYRTVTGTVSME
jgi:hypothetical protein